MGLVQQQRGEEVGWGECQAPDTLYYENQRLKVFGQLLAERVAWILEVDQIQFDRSKKSGGWLLWLATKRGITLSLEPVS